MKHLCEFTDARTFEPVYVNPAHVQFVCYDDGEALTVIGLTDRHFRVSQEIDRVVAALEAALDGPPVRPR